MQSLQLFTVKTFSITKSLL